MIAEFGIAQCDPGILPYVETLRAGGVETFESCQGGPGHYNDAPYIRFHGGPAAGYHAISVALNHGLPISQLSREWEFKDGELTGPYWRVTFKQHAPYDAETERDVLGDIRKRESA